MLGSDTESSKGSTEETLVVNKIEPAKNTDNIKPQNLFHITEDEDESAV